jgi:hypothetical protein
VMALVREHVPMPGAAVASGVSEASFYACVGCFREYLDGAPFDPNAFADALVIEVLAPLRAAESLFTTHPYLTRLRSSFSPDEMTLDPTFVFNDALPDVSHLRDAVLVYSCGDGLSRWAAPRRVELQGGRVVHMPSEQQLANQGQSTEGFVEGLGLPASESIAQADETGPPEVVVDNGPQIEEVLENNPAAEPAPVEAGCGCQQGRRSGWLSLVGLLPWGLRRRSTRSVGSTAAGRRRTPR